MADLAALVLLFDRYLSSGQITNHESVVDAVAAFRADCGEEAAREARETIEWIQDGGMTNRVDPGWLDDASLDLVELLMEMEDQYGVKVAEEQLSDLLERIRKLLGESDDESDGGSMVREPRTPRPQGPMSDGETVEPPEAPTAADAVAGDL